MKLCELELERFRKFDRPLRIRGMAAGLNLIVGPNLWAGFGLVRTGAGTALVGSHDEVAERIAEYHEAGFDHMILSGQPHRAKSRPAELPRPPRRIRSHGSSASGTRPSG